DYPPGGPDRGPGLSICVMDFQWPATEEPSPAPAQQGRGSWPTSRPWQREKVLVAGGPCRRGRSAGGEPRSLETWQERSVACPGGWARGPVFPGPARRAGYTRRWGRPAWGPWDSAVGYVTGQLARRI